MTKNVTEHHFCMRYNDQELGSITVRSNFCGYGAFTLTSFSCTEEDLFGIE